MSIRKFTREQFADKTTIDGNRLESAMQSIEERTDTVPAGDLKQRWTQSKIVLGFPAVAQATARSAVGAANLYEYGIDRSLPWLRIYNQASDSVGGAAEITNDFRLKGTKVPALDPTTYNGSSAVSNEDTQYAWTTSIYLHRPAIIEQCDVIFARALGYAPHVTSGAASMMSDVDLQISVDNPWRPEDQQQSAALLHKKHFNLTSWNKEDDPATTVAYQNADQDVYITLKDLAIPVAPESRVRFSVTVPQYDPNTTAAVPQQAFWGGAATADYKTQLAPWATFVPSIVLTILEPITNG